MNLDIVTIISIILGFVTIIICGVDWWMDQNRSKATRYQAHLDKVLREKPRK